MDTSTACHDLSSSLFSTALARKEPDHFVTGINETCMGHNNFKKWKCVIRNDEIMIHENKLKAKFS
jgi:hypothetical protein